MTNDEVRPVEASARGEEAFWGVSGDAGPGAPGVLRETGDRMAYDLEERTARFGAAVLQFCRKIPRDPANDRLIGQLAGAATSIGANYCEADDAVSKKDFRNRIGTCKKEARETKFFLRMVAVSNEALKPEARTLWQEAKELHLIFCAIWRRSAEH